MIVGGGYVGLEFAQIFARLGSQVTVAERADRLLAREDDEAAKVVREALEADGVEFESSASCFGLKPASDEEKAQARKVALLASRTNFVLTIPMLLCMGSATHGLPF